MSERKRITIPCPDGIPSCAVYHYKYEEVPMSQKTSETKMIIVMRKDLNMRKGKMVAQGSHSAVGLSLWLESNPTDAYKDWLDSSFKKICVSVNSEADLLAIYQKAVDAGLPAKLITDAGHTEFNGVPTKTCCAILGYTNELDPITGELPLL